jgi:hypothetical protein
MGACNRYDRRRPSMDHLRWAARLHVLSRCRCWIAGPRPALGRSRVHVDACRRPCCRTGRHNRRAHVQQHAGNLAADPHTHTVGTRSLLDLFQVAINPQNGKAAIVYTDDDLERAEQLRVRAESVAAVSPAAERPGETELRRLDDRRCGRMASHLEAEAALRRSTTQRAGRPTAHDD